MEYSTLQAAPAGESARGGSLPWKFFETFNTLAEGVHVGTGLPLPQDGGWFRFEQLADTDFGGQVIRRIAGQTGATDQAAGTYTLRYALYAPLMLAGYLYAREQRVPVLRSNVLVANRDWLNSIHLLSPAASETSLADSLFDEVTGFVAALIDAWSAENWVAKPNAWATAVDSLAYGFQMAGRHAVGLDAAWAKWEAAVAGRVFPVRRRPRRFIFTCDGEQDELLVRSGCCLWFTQPSAKSSAAHYCTSCYIEEDERRLEQILAYKRKQKADA